MAKSYGVYVSEWKEDGHCGTFKTLVEAHDTAMGVIRDRTRNVQIFVEWNFQLPFGWTLFRTRKLTNWQTGEY